jgi:hypothetical protein
MVTIAPDDDDEDGRTRSRWRIDDGASERRALTRRRASRFGGERRDAERRRSRERERECVCRAPTLGDLAHEDAHVVRV